LDFWKIPPDRILLSVCSSASIIFSCLETYSRNAYLSMHLGGVPAAFPYYRGGKPRRRVRRGAGGGKSGENAHGSRHSREHTGEEQKRRKQSPEPKSAADEGSHEIFGVNCRHPLL